MKKFSKVTLVFLATLTLVACGAPVEDDELMDDVTVEKTEVDEAD